MSDWSRISISDDLQVSPIGLGTAYYGTKLSEAESCAQIDRYVEAGNLIDTARVYGDWEPGMPGKSEHIIGKWLASRGGRTRIVISTKGAHPPIQHMEVSRVTPQDICHDLELSLRALGTDYIDLYFLHRDDTSLPVDVILECLEEQRKAGRIRYYGCSNWTLPRIIEAQDYARAHGLSGFVCNQLMWSLAAVNPQNIGDHTLVGMDRDTYAYHCHTGMAAMAYMSIASGYFTHLQRGDLQEGVRRKYDTPLNAEIFAQIKALSQSTGLSLAALSLLYFATSPFPTVALASFSGLDQLEECLALLREKPSLDCDLQDLRPDLLI